MINKSKTRHSTIIFCLLLITLLRTLASGPAVIAQKGGRVTFPYPDLSEMNPVVRGVEPLSKLDARLRLLQDQYRNAVRGGEQTFSDRQLSEEFNIDSADPNPTVSVIISLTRKVRSGELTRHISKVYLRSGDLLFAGLPVRSLATLATEDWVGEIHLAGGATLPPVPNPDVQTSPWPAVRGGTATSRPQSGSSGNLSLGEFRSGSLTGQGTIIGIVDTGIDWSHEAFLNPDGTTRIIAIWDQTDDTYDRSGGRIGTITLPFDKEMQVTEGTIYTREHINEALKGRLKIGTMDFNGHGTACAGTAAANGRPGRPGILPRDQGGVAPGAELLIVKAANCGAIPPRYIQGTMWITGMAAWLKKPVVINHSLGTHASSHRGESMDDQMLNGIIDNYSKGVILTAAIGNEASYSFHANGKFGPRRQGQADMQSNAIELVVSAQRASEWSFLNAFFDSRDDWTLGIAGIDNFLIDQDGKPLIILIAKKGENVSVMTPKGQRLPPNFQNYLTNLQKNVRLSGRPGSSDQLTLLLRPGTYQIVGMATTDRVVSGKFDLYLPRVSDASFTIGASKTMMIGTPASAENVIAVGAYDFRGEWQGRDASRVFYNITPGAIASYSNPGGLLPNRIYKPDIAAPATYTISPLSAWARDGNNSPCEGQNMASLGGGRAVTADGRHIAWSGTSAAAPYVAGVISLMLEKNPQLTTQQIRQILIRTAEKGGDLIGGTPNSEWGHGRINPEAALRATPALAVSPATRSKSRPAAGRK